MALSHWFPAPVPLAVGGRIVLASELRLRDYGALETYIDARLGGPPAARLDESADDYPDLLREAYDADREDSWPPSPGSSVGLGVLYGDDHGLAYFLSIALRDTPGLDALALLEPLAADPSAFAAIERVAWGIRGDGRAAILRRIDRFLGLPEFTPRDLPEASTISWSKAVAEVICGSSEGGPGLPWATPEAVGNLTATQWRLIRSGGDPEVEEDAMPEDPELSKRVEEARYGFFYGEDEEVSVETDNPSEANDG